MGAEDLVIVGQILRPHGLQGEVKVLPLTDFSERFEELKYFFIRLQNHSEWKRLLKHRWQGNHLIMKFEGFESFETAENYRSATIEIPRSECHELPEGNFYLNDLIGLNVFTTDGLLVGTLTDVLQQTAQDLYVIHSGDREILIPAVKEFIKRIDIASGEMIIDPIQGLLD